MASNLGGIIDIVAGMSVALTSKTPKAYYGSSLRNWAGPDATPCRIVAAPLQEPQPLEVVQGEFYAGGSTDYTYRFTDLLLYAEIEAVGAGVQEYADDLEVYMANYLDVVSALEFDSIITNDVRVMSLTLTAGAYQFGPDLFIGVAAVWELLEGDP